MRLRLVIGAVAIAAFALFAWTLERKSAARPKRVAVLGHAAVLDSSLDGIKQGLAERGWREGENIHYLYGGPEPSPERLRQLARQYVADGADMVVALSTPSAQAAIEVTETAGVPLLLAPSSDPVAAGLVDSVTHPGRPVTGVSFALQEPRRLEWLQRLVPGLDTVWVPYDHTDASPARAMLRLAPAAKELGITLVTADIRSEEELMRGLAELPGDVDAVLITADARLASLIPQMTTLADPRRLPLSSPHREGVRQGAVMSFGFELAALGRQAARQADLILRGTRAQDLPIEAAEMALSVNIAAADRLGLVIPEHVLRHAIVFGREEEAR